MAKKEVTEAEEMRTDVFRLLPYPLLIVEGGSILFANPAAEQWGFEDGGSIDSLPRDILEIIRDGTIRRKKKKEYRGLVMKLPGFSEAVTIDLSLVPIPSIEHPNALIVSFVDVTWHHQTMDEIARIVLEAEAANRELNLKIRILSELARLGEALLKAVTPADVKDLLVSSLRNTGLFREVLLLESGMKESGGNAALPSDAKEWLEDFERGFNRSGFFAKDTLILCPLLSRESAFGILLLRVWEPESGLISLVEEVRSFVSLGTFALENLLLSDELLDTLRDLSFRNRVSRILQSTRSPHDLEVSLRNLLLSYLPIKWFGIVDSVSAAIPRPLMETVEQALRGQTVVTPDGSGMAVPGGRGGPEGDETGLRRYSVFAIYGEKGAFHSAARRKLIQSVFDTAAIALRNARLYQDIRAHTVALEFLNKELARAVENLKAANEMKSRFVSTVSHEFRTPLTSILSYVETLLAEGEKIDPATRKEFLTVVQDESRRLSRLINQLLDFSRIQSRDTELSIVNVDLADLLGQIHAALEPIAEQKLLEFPEPLVEAACAVLGDRDALHQVLLNIVSNAIQYTLPGGRVRILLDSDEEFAYIHVEDTGVGIPPDSLENIFGEFFTVTQTRAEVARAEHIRSGGGKEDPSFGTGLGLAIAKAIVDRHQGQIEVRSKVGEGTVFTIKLRRRGVEE